MSSDETQLVWSPIYTFLQEQIQQKGQLRLLIAPFARLDALKTLVEMCDDISHLKLVVRWSGKDIISGITDLDIYPYLKEKRIPLYFNPSIHLKLYVFDNACAFHSSGNVTQKGLAWLIGPLVNSLKSLKSSKSFKSQAKLAPTEYCEADIARCRLQDVCCLLQ